MPATAATCSWPSRTRWSVPSKRSLGDPDAAHARARAGRALAVERYDWNALGSRLAQVAQGVRRAEEPHPAPRP